MAANVYIHQTTTNHLQDDPDAGWEFSCHECGYRARYYHGTSQVGPKLMILNIGDTEARHTSSVAPLLDTGPLVPDTSESRYFEEVPWLSQSSIQRLEEILKGLDYV